MRAVMRMGTPIPIVFQNFGTQFSNENSVEYTLFTFAAQQNLTGLAQYVTNAPYPVTNNGPQATPLTGFGGEFILARISCQMHLKNQTTATIRLDTWEMTAKQFTSAADFPTSVITDCVRGGFADRALPTSVTAPYSALQYGSPATMPNMNPRLMSYYRLSRHKRIEILPGQTYHVNLVWAQPKLVNYERINNTGYDYKGITKNFLVRQCGDVGYDLVAGISSYSKTRIDFTYEVRYTCYWSPGLIAKTGVLYDALTNTANATYSINPITGDENAVIANVGGVGVTQIASVSTVH